MVTTLGETAVSLFLLFVLLVVDLPPDEVQTTFPLRFKNICASSGGLLSICKTVHFYLECLKFSYPYLLSND